MFERLNSNCLQLCWKLCVRESTGHTVATTLSSIHTVFDVPGMATTKTHTDVLERRAEAQEIEEEERDHRCCESHRDHRSICDIKSKEIQPPILGFIYYFTGVTVTVT